MAEKTRTIQLQVIGSKAHVDLEVDSSATVASIKQRLAKEFGLDPKVKLLRKHQTSLSTLMDGEKPPKNGRIVVQGVSELKRITEPEAAASAPDASTKAPPQMMQAGLAAQASADAKAPPRMMRAGLAAQPPAEAKAPAASPAAAAAPKAAPKKEAPATSPAAAVAPKAAPKKEAPTASPAAAAAPKAAPKEAVSQHHLWMMAMMTEEEEEAGSTAKQDVEKKAREEEKAKQAREEAERKAKQEEEAARQLKKEEERRTREEEERAKTAREEAERKAREEEEVRRLKEEAEKKAREEEEARRLKEEAERKAKEEEEARRLKEEAERKAREEEEARRLKEETERKAKEEEEERLRKVREEVERLVREEEEAVRRVKELKEEAIRAEEERVKTAKEDIERRTRKEEDARTAREEAERRAKEVMEKAAEAKEEAERKAREEEEARRAREEAEKRAIEKEEEAQRAEDEVESRAREEEEARRAREDAEKRAREEEADALMVMEEAESWARGEEEKARRAREEAEARAREEVGPRRVEEARSFEEEAERKIREEETEREVREEEARKVKEETKSGTEEEAWWLSKELERRAMEEMRLRQLENKSHAEEAEGDTASMQEGVVQVSIKHAIKRGEAKVSVPSGATFGEVKQALANDLGRPELMEGRLVRPVGRGQYQAYYDGEALGAKRRLLYMGPPIVLDNPQEAAAARSSAPRTGKRKEDEVKVAQMPRDENGNPVLTLEQALNLQYDLYVGFVDPEFQAKLRALEQEHPKASIRYMRDKQLLLLTVQEVVLPKYGFKASLSGVHQMLQVMDGFNWNPQFSSRGAVLNELLDLMPPPVTASPVNKETEPPLPAPPTPDVGQTDGSVPDTMDLKDGFTRLVRMTLRATGESVHAPVAEACTLRELQWMLSQPPWNAISQDLRRASFLDGASASVKRLRPGDRVPSTIILTTQTWPFELTAAANPETFLPMWRLSELHEQVLERFRSEDFFRELEKVRDDNVEERKELVILQAFFDVLPAFGFAGDITGFEMYKQALSCHTWHSTVLGHQQQLQDVLAEVSAGLGIGVGSVMAEGQELTEVFWAAAGEEADAEKAAEAEAAGPEEADAEATEVEVRLKHKVDGTELHVLVPPTATMRDVRAAAAAKLGSPSVLKDGRVVKKVGDFLQVYGDEEPLGGKRRLLFLGTPLWNDPTVQAQEPANVVPEETEKAKVEKSPKAKVEEEMVEVVVKLTKGDDKVTVSVPKGATIKDVKEALAQKLNRPKLATTANVVRKVQGGFAAHRDTERLGGKRLLTVLGVDHLKAVAVPSAPPNLSVNQALSMQYELHEGFMDPEFLSKLKDIIATHSSDSAAFRRERNKLILAVQSDVLPKYGFEANLQGSVEMVQVMSKYSAENEEIARLGNEISVCLGMASSGEQQASTAEQEATPTSPVEDMTLEIKHAVHGTKVNVTVPSTATMRDAKEALAARLQKPEYVKRGRIVRSQGSTFTALPEDTVIGRRRQLLYMGPPLVVEASPMANGHEEAANDSSFGHLGDSPAQAQAANDFSFGHIGDAPAQPQARELGDGEVEVTVKPAVEDQGGSVTLIAKSSMNIAEVRQLLAKALGRPEVAKTVRIVRKSKKGANEGVLVSVKDTEVLGDKWRKRTLLVLNCDLPKSEVAAEEAQAEMVPFFGIPVELSTHQNALTIGIIGKERKDITVEQVKSKLLLHTGQEKRPTPADFTCLMDVKGDGRLVPLADYDRPGEIMNGQSVVLQLAGFTAEQLAAWVRAGQEAIENFRSTRQRPEQFAKPTPQKIHQDRMINVGLQFSTEQVFVKLQDDSTVLDLKLRLKEEYGVPSGVEVLARAKDGFFVTLEDFARPKRVVVLKGVATLNRASRLLEDDMLKAMDEFNKKYAKADFQKEVTSWKEGSTSVETFRDVTRQIAFEVLPKFGFKASKEGLTDWTTTARVFMRFPTFAESWRKGQILLGTLGDKEAVRMYRMSVSHEKGPMPNRESKSQYGNMLVREISSYAALAREKKDADEAIDIMYNRIYEENREELWEGGKVKGHKMPSRWAVRRKYLEMPGTTVLHCTPQDKLDSVVGGAVVFEVQANGLDFSRLPQIGEGENYVFNTEGAAVEESDDENQDHLEHETPSHISVGYIDALASTPGSRAGGALLEHLNTMAASEGWDMLALHSIRVEHTLRFWEKQGFQYFGPGKDAAFRLQCLQNVGFAVSIASLERTLPPRPGCLFYVKFLSQA